MTTALLCLAVVMIAGSTCQAYQLATKCTCLRNSETILRLSQIRSYSEQKLGLCNVAAVVFVTVKNKVVCSDPKKPWVEKAIKNLKKKAPTPAATGANPTEDPSWFVTVKNKVVCSDPKKPWVEKATTDLKKKAPTPTATGANPTGDPSWLTARMQ